MTINNTRVAIIGALPEEVQSIRKLGNEITKRQSGPFTFEEFDYNGLQDEIENANALCSRCNDRKCAKLPKEFMYEEFDRLKNYFTNRGMEKEFKELCRENSQ